MPADPPRLRARLAACFPLLLCALLLLSAPEALAGPFIWDQDDDKVDDRIESVHLLGYSFAFEDGDSLMRKRIDVSPLVGGLVYGIYIHYAQTPTETDVAALTALGVPVLHRFTAIPSVRGVATFAQIQTITTLPGVERVEAVPVLYPMLREGQATAGVRDPSQHVFPDWAGTGGTDGAGVVVAILDTGINDAPDGGYPGHESLFGRFVGGADFTRGDSTLNTALDGSENPADYGSAASRGHGTHVAGIAVGNGGPSGYAQGVAPAARFVDVKVLNDFGYGTGVAEALDWCIHNRTRAWGVPGAAGIQVINLSLSSPDETDGNDAASRLAARAVELGIVVVASSGNEGTGQHVPSPAGGDGVLAVGAIDHQRTADDEDDTFATLSAYGPRAPDGDLDAADEQKPDLMAPGVAILSADGDPFSDGAQYRRMTGTSMSAAFVSGAAAALRSRWPSLAPADIARVLRSTALRELEGVPAGQGGTDPGWLSPIGFGVVDLYAASLELTQPERSQVRGLLLRGSGSTIEAEIRTMRERGAAHFVIERAPDVAGTPGAFTAIDSAAAVGDSTLADGTNLSRYPFNWTVPPGEHGVPFWYRVAHTESGARYETSARRFVSPTGPPAATVEITVVHNAYDSDVSGAIEVGNADSPSVGAPASWSPAIVVPLPGSAAAVESDWVTGTSTTGNIAWTFAVDVPQGDADTFLPPDATKLWRLRVEEGGFLNRSGRVVRFRVVWHSPSGDLAYTGAPIPLQTLEGQAQYATAPNNVVDAGTPAPRVELRAGPNPVASGDGVTFSLPRTPRGELRVFDLAGRQVGRAAFRDEGGSWSARWESRDGSGRPIPAGLYFAHVGDAGVARLVVVAR